MSETIQVCPWTVAVRKGGSTGVVAGPSDYSVVQVSNQERGLSFRWDCTGDVTVFAGPIASHVAQIERAAPVYCFVAWDHNADELVAAMKAAGAPFAPGYGADVPITVQRLN